MKISPDYKIYPTSLVEFRWKPRSWYIKQLRSVEKEHEDSPQLRVGKVVHKVLESFYDEINPELAKSSTESHFLDIVKVLKQRLWDYKIPAEKSPIVDEMLRNFALNSAYNYRDLLNKHMESQFMPLVTEKELISKKYPIGAIIDKINQSHNALDYKSDAIFPEILYAKRETLKDYDIIKYDYYYEYLVIQATFAAILIEENYGKLPQRFIFVYLRHLNVDGSKGTIIINITPEKKTQVLSWANQMLEDIKNDKIPSCLKRDPKACFKYNSICQYKSFCDSIGLCVFSL